MSNELINESDDVTGGREFAMSGFASGSGGSAADLGEDELLAGLGS